MQNRVPAALQASVAPGNLVTEIRPSQQEQQLLGGSSRGLALVWEEANQGLPSVQGVIGSLTHDAAVGLGIRMIPYKE